PQEEVQLVASELRIEFALLGVLQLRPRQDEAELGELRILRQRRVKREHLGEAVVSLEAARYDIIQHELLVGRKDADLLLLREVLRRVQAVLQAQIDERGRLLG